MTAFLPLVYYTKLTPLYMITKPHSALHIYIFVLISVVFMLMCPRVSSSSTIHTDVCFAGQMSLNLAARHCAFLRNSSTNSATTSPFHPVALPLSRYSPSYCQTLQKINHFWPKTHTCSSRLTVVICLSFGLLIEISWPAHFKCCKITFLMNSFSLLMKLINWNHLFCLQASVRKGILPSMLEEILNTRIMVKQSMKTNKQDKVLLRLLDARQLGLKLIANVTFGYTAANYSGRMPNVEVSFSTAGRLVGSWRAPAVKTNNFTFKPVFKLSGTVIIHK